MDKRIKIVFNILFISTFFISYSQSVVDLEGIENGTLKNKIEKNTSLLIDRINEAYRNNSNSIDFSGIEMTNDAKVNIDLLWESSHFMVQDIEIYEKLLLLYNSSNNIKGYQLRNIILYIKEADEGEKNKEAVILYTKDGLINDMYISIGYKNYKSVMSDGKTVKDLRLRNIILDFIENFRTAYNKKDINFINKVFSDDALIIVGKQIKVQSLDGGTERVITKYIKRNKKEYIARLKSAFKHNKYINVKFEDIRVVRHTKYKDFYGVTVKQKWFTPGYKDEGYVFLLIDLRNVDQPAIHIRTWDKKDNFNIRSFPISDFK